MIKNYFKQAWASACHNKVSTCLYLSGVALAIATVMVISIVIHTQLSPIYPEYNRDRMAYVESCFWERGKSNGNGGFPWQMLDPFFGNLKNAEAVSIRNESSQRNMIGIEGSDKEIMLNTLWVNDGFFRVYTYEFLAGSPITASEIASEAKVAILDRPTAEAMFGSVEGAIDKNIVFEATDHKVKGVVRESSELAPMSYANVFMPLSVRDRYREENEMGPYKVIILMKKGASIDDLHSEISARYDTWNKARAKIDEFKYNLNNQPKSHYVYTFNPWTWTDESNTSGIEDYLIIGLVLLLVPALNLSGLVSGNVHGRANEIGIRKSFGASRKKLLGEIIAENFILTSVGSIIGLVIAWIIIITFSDWVFSIHNMFIPGGSAKDIHADMLFSPIIFLIAFGAALLLNTVSSLIPAWRSLRRPIVESLNQKL